MISSPRECTTPTVLVIGPSGEPRGGISRYVDDILKYLAQSNTPYTHIQSHPGVPPVGRTFSQWLYVAQRRLQLMAQVCTYKNPNLNLNTCVHLHLTFHRPMNDAFLCWLVARCQFRRTIVSLHGGVADRWAYLLRRPLIRQALEMNDVLHVQTSEMVTVFDKSGFGDQVLYAPMTILRKSRPTRVREKAEPLRIIYVGLMTPLKGTSILIEAVRLLLIRHASVTLTLIGACEPDYQERFTSEVAGLNVVYPEACHWVNRQPEDVIFSELEQSHVFCMPTSWPGEGTPLSVVEAMSNSLPIVATPWRGLKDLVKSGYSGILVEEGSSVKFAEALYDLYADEELRLHYAAGSRQRFDQYYSADAMGRSLQAMYAFRSETSNTL